MMMRYWLGGLLVLTCSAASADEVDDIVRAEMENQHIPGLSLAIVRDGQVVKEQGYGLANVELNVPAKPETVYQLQSITKSFTATAIMMLVEEGKVALDDPISKYLDGTPESWRKITVRHLLSHMSGLKDFINQPTQSLRFDVTEREVLDATAKRPLDFQPGERYQYSNTNYHLLAMIIRKVTGESWGDFVAERICKPLGMEDTRAVSLTDLIPNRAAGYSWTNGNLVNGSYVAESVLGYAGGGLCSTVRDMVKWDAALNTETLLKRSSLERMWTSAKLNDGSLTGYGFGWSVGEVKGHRFVTHSGQNSTGFTTLIIRYLDDKLTIIILTNLDGANPAAIVRQVVGPHLPDLAPSGG